MKLFLPAVLLPFVFAAQASKTDLGNAMSPEEHAMWMRRADEILGTNEETSAGLRKLARIRGGAETVTRRGGCGRIIAKNEGTAIEVTNGNAISFMDDGDDDRVFCTDTLCAGDGEAMVLYNGECNVETTTLTFIVLYEDVGSDNDEVRFWCPSLEDTAAISCSGVAGTTTDESGPVAEVDVTTPVGTADCVLTCTPPAP